MSVTSPPRPASLLSLLLASHLAHLPFSTQLLSFSLYRLPLTLPWSLLSFPFLSLLICSLSEAEPVFSNKILCDTPPCPAICKTGTALVRAGRGVWSPVQWTTAFHGGLAHNPRTLINTDKIAGPEVL